MFYVLKVVDYEGLQDFAVMEGNSLGEVRKGLDALEAGQYVVVQTVATPTIELPEPKKRISFETTRKRAPRKIEDDGFGEPEAMEPPKKLTAKKKAK